MTETLPAAERLDCEDLWDFQDVNFAYPDILLYWGRRGVTDIKIMPCRPVNEDCLYLNGKWYSYCRHEFEWKKPEDLSEEEAPPKAKARKQRRKV